MGAGLIGQQVGRDSAADDLRQHLGTVAQESHGNRPAFGTSLADQPQGLIERIGFAVEEPGLQPSVDACRVALDGQH